jgi:hypothetical protein
MSPSLTPVFSVEAKVVPVIEINKSIIRTADVCFLGM